MFNKKRLFRILILFLLVNFWTHSLTANECSRLFKPVGGSSVELEMSVNQSVLALLTTRDGTIGGLYTGLRPQSKLYASFLKVLRLDKSTPPKDYLDWAAKVFPSTAPFAIQWDSVPYQLRLSLINHASTLRSQDFFNNRRIPNLIVRPRLTLVFTETTQFLGRSYSAGIHVIDVEKNFGAVEYRSPSDLNELKGIELHLRNSKLSPGETIDSAWVLQNSIGAGKTHLHEHIVAPIPFKSLEEKPAITALSIVEFYRRANLLAELISIDSLAPIRRISKGDLEFFGSIKGSFLSGIYSYFNSLNPKAETALGSDYKIGYVGFRGADTYDRPGLYGFEYRSITPWKSPFIQKRVADRISEGLMHESYGFTEKSLTDWVNFRGIDLKEPNAVSAFLENIWYGKQIEVLFNELPPHLKYLEHDEKFQARLKPAIDKNEAIMMLMYDWSQDPLYFNDPDGVARLNQEQLSALNKIAAGSTSLQPILRNFIWRSGLMDKLLQSFEIDRSEINVSKFNN